MSEALLPVHGFVLAGGRSSRMGRDKALLPFRGRPMVELAVEKLRSFCTEVSIAGNREDLAGFAEVVSETRVEAGPAAGIEAGLKACRQPWALFVPVDVPLMPSPLLQRYATTVIEMGTAASCLAATYVGIEDAKPKPLPGGLDIGGTVIGRFDPQPAFCMLRSSLSSHYSTAMDRGERRLRNLLHQSAKAAGEVDWVHDLFELYGYPEYRGPDAATAEYLFLNVNTPADLVSAESWAANGTQLPSWG